ncbi:ABC transporter ATP-binding protein [Alicyclobacillus sp. SO9]|nr:ABC transporter ATP-binding protein [Alicyclobacillus sp. SO9]
MKESPKPRAAVGFRSLTRLLPFARPYTWHFIAVLVLVAIFNISNVLQPYLVKVAIDSDISTKHPNLHGVILISLLYIGVVLAGVLANYGQIMLLQYAGQNVIRSIRMHLFEHIERQAMKFFDRNAIGSLVTNISSDTETVSQFFTNFFLSMIRDGMSIVMIIVAMFELNVPIAAESMVILPIIFLISLFFRRRLRKAYQTTRTRLSNIVSFLAENLAGMRITQIFHQEARQRKKYQALNRAHFDANIHEYGLSVMFNRTFELFGNISVAAIAWIGGLSVLHHAILFGTLYAFISYIRQFFQPINAITQQWNTLQSSMVAAERLGGVLSVQPEVVDPENPMVKTDDEIAGTVSFHNVSFGYSSDRLVLKDIDFTVNRGEFIGFVGATGAGKSSIMSLLIRFYDVTSGVILLDGTDIRQFRQADLHRYIGLVQQDVYLFTGTVVDNIRLFRSDITEEAVIHAAKTVGAHDIIQRLPQGYRTQLYAKGANLSMGERQLISFARVVALNPKVLILDEATANLDSQTEELVQKGLQAVSKDRTTLVIAHRLSTIRHADRILVLDKGRVVEQGTHHELLAKQGLYRDLHEKSGIEDNSRQTDNNMGNELYQPSF